MQKICDNSALFECGNKGVMGNMNDTYTGFGLERLGYKGVGDFLSRNKAPIIISFLACFSTLVLFAYLLVPTTYAAKASIVVGKPQFQSLFGVFSVVPQDPRIAAPSIILQSDAFAEKIVSRLNLQLEEGERLGDRVSISTNNSGLIMIKARSKNAEESANIANAYVDELGAEVKAILAAALADKKARLESLHKDMQGNELGNKERGVTLASSLVELAMLDIGVAATSEFVHVVDHAKAVEAKATPQRLRWMTVAAIFSLAFSMVLAAYLNYRKEKCSVAA